VGATPFGQPHHPLLVVMLLLWDTPWRERALLAARAQLRMTWAMAHTEGCLLMQEVQP
jgi:hypothetical protein